MPLAALTRELAEEIAREFPELRRLNLSRNALRELEHLRLLPHLAQLDLSHNALRVVPAALGAWLPRLARLNLRGNAIESLAGLAACAELAFLDAGDNRVALLGELRFLVPLGRLEELALDGNPVETRHAGAHFRREALAMLPRLRVLDGHAVTPAERLYSRLQVKSELTVAELEQGEEEESEGDASERKSGGSDPHPADRVGAAAASRRLLTPASIHLGRRDGQVESAGADVDSADTSEIARERREQSPPRKSRTSERTDRVWSVPSDPKSNNTHANPEYRHGHDGYNDDSGGRWGRHDKRPPPREDVQLQVVLEDQSPPGPQGDQTVGYDRGSHSRSASSSVVVVSSPSWRGGGDRPENPAQQEHALLQRRVEALERILALQDSTMQKEMASMAGESTHPLSSVATSDSDGESSGQRTARLYVKMLGMWREKVVALMVQIQCMELTRHADGGQLRKRLARLEGSCGQLQAQCEVWEQRVKDTEAQRDLQLSRVLETEKRCEAANNKVVAAVRTMAAERDKLQRAAELVAVFTASDGIVSQKMSELAGGLKRVDTLKRRLERMCERLTTAALLSAHREARLRNTEAAMEAERRVLVHRVQKLQEAAALHPTGGSGADCSAESIPASSPTDALAAGSGAAARRLRQHRKLLRPATEAALRALFHRLDVYETGLVRSSVLLEALRCDEGLARAVGGRDAATSLVAHVQLALERQQSASTLDVALPRNPGGHSITWGEFLLLFLPDAPSANALGGGAPNGRQVGLWDSDALPCGLCASLMLRHGGQVPACEVGGAPSPSRAASRQQRPNDRRPQQSSRRELLTELSEVRQDRDALRRRVLADAHDLQARAAAIRDAWKRKTEQLACDNEDLRHALEASRNEAASLRKQCEEAERASAAAQHALDNLRRESLVRESDFAREKQALERQRQESVEREQEIWRKEMQDAGFRHSALQAEHVKQQAHLRQLERELANMQERATAREAERVVSLENRVAKRDGEIAKLRRERNALLSTLRDQERKLAVQSAKAATAAVGTQTEEAEAVETVVPVPVRTAATQTQPTQTRTVLGDDEAKRGSKDTNSALGADQRPPDARGEAARAATRSMPRPADRLSPEDVTRRLERLQTLTASLLDD